MTFLVDRAAGSDKDSFHIAPIGKVIRRAEHIACMDARKLIECARSDAARIVEQAQVAYQAERERGYAEGIQAGKAEQAAAMVRLGKQTSTYLKDVERELVDVVVASLRRIVADFDAAERVLAVVRSGLALVRQQKQVLLRVHTDDATLVRRHMQDLLSRFPSVDYVDVVADDRFERGACRIETAIGTVETSLDKQVAILQHALEQAVPGVPEDASHRATSSPAMSPARDDERGQAQPYPSHDGRGRAAPSPFAHGGGQERDDV
jgi:type III secretion protein L